MTLTGSMNKRLYDNIIELSSFIKNLIYIQNKEFINLYNKYLKNKAYLIKKHFSKEIILKKIPEIKIINNKLKRKKEDIIILGFIEEALKSKIKIPNYQNEKEEFKQLQKKMRAYKQYFYYLIQRKIGLINHSVPGAEQIEKELGIKPFKE